MAYSKATLVQQVRYLLQDTPAADSLTGSYSAAGLTLTVADATLYDKGDIIEFVTDGDTFLVNSAAGTTITMIAAGLSWDGATNASHASGAIFYLRPQFRYLAIVEAIDATIAEMWPYAWKAVTDTITPVSGTVYYDAATSTTTGMDLIDAIQRTSDGLSVVRYGDSGKQYGNRGSMSKGGRYLCLERGLPTALAASGQGYYIPYFDNTTYTIAVRVRAKLTNTFSSPNYSDLTGGNMTDAIVYGACARLIENTEVPRVTQSDVTMGDASVGAGARIRDGSYFYQRFLHKRDMIQRELEVSIPRMPKWR